MSDSSNTPMMAQFNAIKERYPDTILFFRMGDFYEMFGEDAKTASKILGIALTTRNKHAENCIPMCGIPYQKYQSYALKLVKAGHNVALCDQLEDPSLSKGIVKRGVTRVITPSTMIDSEELTSHENNFLMAIYITEATVYTTFADISTGEVYISQNALAALSSVTSRFEPKEIVANIPITGCENTLIRKAPDVKDAALSVLRRYKVKDGSQLGITNANLFVCLDMAFSYVEERLLRVNFVRPALLVEENELVLDHIARRTLEITRAGGEGGLSLYEVLNHTATAMGARALQRRLRSPTRDRKELARRFDEAELFIEERRAAAELTERLSHVHDIERIINRVSSKRANARELAFLKNSLAEFPHIAKTLESLGRTEAALLLNAAEKTRTLIEAGLAEEPSQILTEGGIIKEGYHKDVDRLRHLRGNSTSLLNAQEAKLKKETGIGQLKISYNKVFGFFIEVSKNNASKMPARFERKQTLAGAERYTTPEIKMLENDILTAEEKLFDLEYKLFCELRDKAAEEIDTLRIASGAIGELDVNLSFAKVALTRHYTRPEMTGDGTIELIGLRHPTVEAASKELYIANDYRADSYGGRLQIVTGPNMAGKSTYIRSVALAALLAHIGSFVPAKTAKIALTDRIFTRIGASDNIAYGQSTFMVEMVETANILAHATKDSLIILDEIGRGTSTYDGVSIAWAVAEYILNKIRAKTLFATHYHELTDMERSMPDVKNLTVTVKEENGEVIFLHKIEEGTTDKSYGIYVGELAGLPKQVIKSAKNVLAGLERAKPRKKKEQAVEQVILFDNSEHPAVAKLQSIDTNRVTPMEALALLAELRKMAAPD